MVGPDRTPSLLLSKSPKAQEGKNQSLWPPFVLPGPTLPLLCPSLGSVLPAGGRPVGNGDLAVWNGPDPLPWPVSIPAVEIGIAPWG